MASELIRTACPTCATKIGVRLDQLGRRIRCPKCRSAFAVNQPEVEAESPVQAPASDPTPWQTADDANELAAVGRGREVWHRAKISGKFDRPRDLLFQAAVQTVRNARCDVIHIDWANAHLRFALFVAPGQPTEHDLFAFAHPTGGSEVEVTSQSPNVDGVFDPHYHALLGELGKYMLFVPPTPAAQPLPPPPPPQQVVFALPPPDDWSPPVSRRRQEEGSSGLGIAGFVCGLVGVVLSCIPLFAWILGILGVTFGGIAMANKREGLGIAGFVLGLLALVFGTIFFLAFLPINRY